MPPFPPRRRVYLMRHGEVDYFLAGRPVPTDTATLNEEGREQAAAAAAVLAEAPIDRVVISGLPRTAETAAIVLGGRSLPIEVVEQLREIRGGSLAELTDDERRVEFITALTRPLAPDGRFLLGERWGDFHDRVVPAFRALVATPGWRHMLVVAHGATNRIIIADMLGLPLESLGHLEQDPACINLLDLDEQGYAIARLLNYTPYNPLKAGLDLTTMEHYFLKWPAPEER